VKGRVTAMDACTILAPTSAPRHKTGDAPGNARCVVWDRSGLASSAPDEHSDEVLVARVAAGDQRAFAMIVRRHTGRLRALATAFCGMAAEADDIVQETFWSFWRHAGRWRPDGPPLSAYLARIALNRAIDARRRRRVRAFFGIEDAEAVPDGQIMADERLAIGGELAAVSRDLGELPERQRAAVLLAADGERTNAEIAAIMELSVGAVEQLLVRARRALRQRLAARDDNKETNA
jgi:RNA polymerase sigma-70 factor (ECF subfamily)